MNTHDDNVGSTNAAASAVGAIGEIHTLPDLPNLTIDRYDERIEAERAAYNHEYQNRAEDDALVQRVPLSWTRTEGAGAERIRVATGGWDEISYIVNFVNQRAHARILSLGSGPCGLELFLARKLTASYEIVCTDINPQLIELGIEHARREGLHLTGQAIDLNKLWLEPESFDLVYAHASLHHLVTFEHIFAQINQGLRPDGEFVTVDVTGRNGFLLREKTAKVVEGLFQALPDRYKYNHTSTTRVVFTPHYAAASTGEAGFECVRTQDLLPLLAQRFQPAHYVPLFCLMRRFFDTMYGPNYDFSREQDRQIFDMIRALDEHLLDAELLLPETFFAVLRRGDTPETPTAARLKARMMRDAGPADESASAASTVERQREPRISSGSATVRNAERRAQIARSHHTQLTRLMDLMDLMDLMRLVYDRAVPWPVRERIWMLRRRRKPGAPAPAPVTAPQSAADPLQ